MMPQLILASSSPRRKELLTDAGFTFQCTSPSTNAECGVCSQETPPEYVARMAYQKALDVAECSLHQSDNLDAIVIGCDTVAECAGQILGKPVDVTHARTMLQLLSGREHHVYSGLCLIQINRSEPRLGQPHVKVDRTTLRMDPLDENQLNEYLASGQWEGKAGAFGYQDRPGWLTIVEGSESNVVGLPMELLSAMLLELGYTIEPSPSPAS